MRFSLCAWAMTSYLSPPCWVWWFSQVKLLSRMCLTRGESQMQRFIYHLQNKWKHTHTLKLSLFCQGCKSHSDARGPMHSHSQEPARQDESEGQISAHSVTDTLASTVYLVSTSHCLQTISDQLSVSAGRSFLQLAVSQLALSIFCYLFPISLVIYSNTGLELQGLHNPARCISSQHHLD